MKRASFIFFIMTMVLMTSCMAMDSEFMTDIERVQVNGIVIDEEENPINHIKVKMEWDSPYSPMIVYSSSKGYFTADLEIPETGYPVKVSVEISDIDGEDNGGLFQTRTDEIIILDEAYSESSESIITYRLTHATASENNRRSL